jgi:hypothetical protein
MTQKPMVGPLMSCDLCRSDWQIANSASGARLHKLLPTPANASMVTSIMSAREAEMAKGQMKGNKEAKKPKADKDKGAGSSYKQSQGSSLSATTETFKKKK